MEVDVHGSAHCEHQGCNQLDFLPFKCDECNKTYCLSHASSHPCASTSRRDRRAVVCPLCSKGLALPEGQDPNIAWDFHFNTDCTQQKSKIPKCPVEGCRDKLHLSNRFECGQCKRTYCVKHRAPEAHPCADAGAPSGARPKPAPRAAPAPKSQPSRPSPGAAPAAAVIGRTQVDDEELAMRLQQEEIARAQGAIADDDLVVGQPVVSNESAGRPLVGARSKMAERANRAKKAVKSMFSCLPSSSRAQSSQR
mmetsp:Transcript_17783/g.38303  ORF Transcript_17783/g.38303 Transcript_17783/m.38303 type:complete len:252 (+) Transcript_17783:26-781(+)